MSDKGILYQPKYHIPFPSIQINEYLEGGGIPSGSIIQIQSSSKGVYKSSTALEMLGYAQDQGLKVGYIDAENAVTENSRKWVENMGINVDELYYQGWDYGEELYKKIYEWVEEEGVKVIVLDSIHSTQPQVMYDEDVGQHHIGTHATLHKKGLMKCKKLVRKHDFTLIAINHRGVNLTQSGAFGTKPKGGKSWEFYSEFIFIMSRTDSRSKLQDEELIPLEIYIDKNKGGPSFKKVRTYARQGYGIERGAEILMKGLEQGIIQKNGAWYNIKGESVQGETNAIEYINENQEEILEQISEESQ